MLNAKRLVYFEPWFDTWSSPEARRLMAAQSDIALVGLNYAAPESTNWVEVGRAHGYQIAPQVELKQPWFGSRALIERCHSLLAICSTGSGCDVIDISACTDAGVIVCNQAGANKEAVAEHALCLMIALSKKIGQSDKLLRRGDAIDRNLLRGSNIRGKTIGLIGIGQIGTRMAELCSVLFEMQVLAYDPYLTAEEIRYRHATKVGFEEVFRNTDYVSVHCPRTEETLGMIGREQFRLMKPTAHFVTTARGGIHDEDALAEALSKGRLAGAGLDVFVEEPPPSGHPLLAFDNVIATPHIAGTTFESIAEMGMKNALQWLTIFRGEVPPRLVNSEVWPRYSDRFEELLGVRPQAFP